MDAENTEPETPELETLEMEVSMLSSSDSEVESDEEASEVDTDQLESESEEKSDLSEDLSEGEGAEEGGEDGEMDKVAQYISRNKQISWCSTNEKTLHYTPAPRSLVPGLTRYAVSRIRDPVSSFALLLTDEILKHIVDMTNLYGKRNIAEWKDTDIVELRAYVGLLILAGVYRSKHESTFSLWSEKAGRGIFGATMSRNRFRLLCRALRFDNKKIRDRYQDDKLAPFRKVWNMWTERLPMMFSPDRDICVDEQLVPFRGRCSFRHMSKKPAKYGIRIWAVCDVKTSYAWRLQVYTGKAADGKSEVNQGMRVVLDLTEGLKGYIVTCDNFFTSYALSEELLKRKMALVGTICKNKPELPPSLLQIKDRTVFSSTFAFTQTHTLVSYVQRRGKNVLFLSTKHRTANVDGGQRKTPNIILDYNRCKGGIDNLDKCVGTYTCRRKTRRWPQALFHNLLDVSLFNAFILWTSVEPTWHQKKTYRRRLFIEEVGEALVNPHIKRRAHLPRTSTAAAIVSNLQNEAVLKVPAVNMNEGDYHKKSRKRCEMCNHTRRVYLRCCKCRKFICKDHSVAICNLCFK